MVSSPPPPSSLSPTLVLGIKGFSWPDLHDASRLADLHRMFLAGVAAADGDLARRYDAYAADPESMKGPEESELLLEMAPKVEVFISQLFGIEQEVSDQVKGILSWEPVAGLKEFISKRVWKRGGKSLADSPQAEEFLSRLARIADPGPALGGCADAAWDEEVATGRVVGRLLRAEKALEKARGRRDPQPVPPGVREDLASLHVQLQQEPSLLPFHTPFDAASDDQCLDLVTGCLTLLERGILARAHRVGSHHEGGWASLTHPRDLDYHALVELRRPVPQLPELLEGPPHLRRPRTGFALTDSRWGRRELTAEVHYCLYCHARSKDSCSNGFVEPPQPGALPTHRPNPLGIPLAGCPLDERISEAHQLRRNGHAVGAVAMICLDNPMAPGTGHRICNDCMKACIFQKQEPVNIPQLETGALSEVLNLPWGFEIWSLLTRWNPLNVRRPHPAPHHGHRVLVVGQGPAGYTLAHHLLNEGFGVVGIDGLKLEPLPEAWTGSPDRPPEPIHDVNTLRQPLDERVGLGFGGVSEYGITVRWDKNFLTLLYLNLLRRPFFRVYGGMRFGGTVTVHDAWDLGFHHIAIAAGAGRPTVIGMKNNLIRGIRKASDFLMALQLSGAYRKDSLASLQVELPAVVIGGGLTAIDTATELLAYYPVQVEKALQMYRERCDRLGEEEVFQGLSASEIRLFQKFVSHGLQVEEEKRVAAEEGRILDLAKLCQSFGGVTIAYRRPLTDSPAYRLNHEEVTKALEEGIRFAECLSPVEAIPDAEGSVTALRLERQALINGKLRGTGEIVELPARSVCVAAGTSPNITYEKEWPGHFELDERGYFLAHRARMEGGGESVLEVVAKGEEPGFFTSYEGPEGQRVSFYGDNHPTYAGNVVKAMASARQGHRAVVDLFHSRIQRAASISQSERKRNFQVFAQRLDQQWIPRVHEVIRLTDTIVEMVVHAPAAARQFRPGQFYRLQDYETRAPRVGGKRVAMEGLALTGAWTDPERGLLSTIVLEMGASSRLCATLKPGDPVVLMGPTGEPTEIPAGETVLLVGGGLGNAVLFSIARALRERGNRVLYFAGYRKAADLFKREEVEASTDQVIWAVDSGPVIPPHRSQDRTFVGNIVEAMEAYAMGKLDPTVFHFCEVDRIICIGSDRMMAAVKTARKTVLKEELRADHVAIGSINSPMQCMMKEVCAQCLQKHVDPITGAEAGVVFTCFNQDQPLDVVDFEHLRLRLSQNSLQEKLADSWMLAAFERGALNGV